MVTPDDRDARLPLPRIEVIPGPDAPDLDDLFPDLAARRPHPRIAAARRAAIAARVEEARRAEEEGRDKERP
jgi:hypothetical protein